MQDLSLEINPWPSDLQRDGKKLVWSGSYVITSVRMTECLGMFYSNSACAIHSSENTFLRALRQARLFSNAGVRTETKLVPGDSKNAGISVCQQCWGCWYMCCGQLAQCAESPVGLTGFAKSSKTCKHGCNDHHWEQKRLPLYWSLKASFSSSLITALSAHEVKEKT